MCAISRSTKEKSGVEISLLLTKGAKGATAKRSIRRTERCTVVKLIFLRTFAEMSSRHSSRDRAASENFWHPIPTIFQWNQYSETPPIFYDNPVLWA